MQTDAQRLEAVEVALRRWHTRLTRATNAIRKLEAKRRRLGAKPRTLADRPRGHDKGGDHMKVTTVPVSEIPLPELDAFFLPTKPVPLIQHDDLAVMPSNQKDDLTIPPEFKRVAEQTAPGKPGPKLLSDMINKPFIDARKKKRLDQMDEKRRGRSRFSASDMPLSGRDAIKAIKDARRKK